MGMRPCIAVLMAAIALLGKPPAADESSAALAPTAPLAISFVASSYTVDLPWFHRDLSGAPPQDTRYFKFEANGLDLPPGEYAVALIPYDVRQSVSVRVDEGPYRDIPVRGGRAELGNVPIRSRILRFFLKAQGVVGNSPLSRVLVYSPGISFEEAEVAAIPFGQVRNRADEWQQGLTKTESPEMAKILNRKGFGPQQIETMAQTILESCARRQVLDPNDPHCGAVGSDETPGGYDYRQSAAAAVLFARAWRDTGRQDWQRRAILARDYVYKAQWLDDPNDKARYGAFRAGATAGLRLSPSKSSSAAVAAAQASRALPPLSGVDTCIAIHLLAAAMEAGLPLREVERFRAAAEWICRGQTEPGVFRLPEAVREFETVGSDSNRRLRPIRRDLLPLAAGGSPRGSLQFSDTLGLPSSAKAQDSLAYDALAAMALVEAYACLDRLGEHPPNAWLEAAQRGLRHCLDNLDAFGHTINPVGGDSHRQREPISADSPLLAAGGSPRGSPQFHDARNLPSTAQAISEQCPDQAIGFYALVVACQSPALRNTPGVQDAMGRIARWWLADAYVDPSPPLATIDVNDAALSRQPAETVSRRQSVPVSGDSPLLAAGGSPRGSPHVHDALVLPSTAVSYRLVAAATLVRISQATNQAQPWQAMAAQLVEHVYVKLWKPRDPRHPSDSATACDGLLLQEVRNESPEGKN